METYIKQLRPDHWIKNIFVFVPLVFSLELMNLEKISGSILAFISFCFVSSAVYTFNDILDADKDAMHPVKCARPIASGAITKQRAGILSIVLLICGEGISFRISRGTGIFLTLYIIVNILYTLKLKHVSILDCFCIAAGFVLRVYVGGIATETVVSDWLFLTIVVMSLFMGFGKRQGEMLKVDGSMTRKVLMQYDIGFLNGMVFTCAGLTIVFYSLWAMSRQSVMIYTVPVVIFIVCRYLLDVCKNDSYGDPTTVIFKDKVEGFLSQTYCRSTYFCVLGMQAISQVEGECCMDQYIRPGNLWLDTNGKPIQAHGFSVFYNEQDNLWYWYGENKEKTDGKGFIWHWGVRLYTSQDLCNWEDRGLIIPPQPEDLTSPLHPTYCMDRPHIIYCTKTGKYVAWLKIMAGVESQFMSVLTAERFEGPYTFVRKIYKPLDMDSGDFCLYADSDGRAYIWFERPHFQLICATLTDDYTAVTGEYSVHFDGLRPPLTREAPTYFERGGKRYLFTSGTSSYFPNPSRVCMFTDPHGRYTDLGDPFVGDKRGTSFYSQITSVIRIPGTDRYIACADRWMPQRIFRAIAKQALWGMKLVFRNYQPDTAPKKAMPLPEVEQRHRENTSISRYVWLPIEWEGDKPVIRWQKKWKPSG